MAERPDNKAVPGMHHHLGGRPPARDPATPRGEIDRVFGTEAPVICGCAIEVGSGAMPVEWQLAEHVVRIYRDYGESSAWAIRNRFLVAAGVDRGKLENELIARNLLPKREAEPS
jgi:hypothetical protein